MENISEKNDTGENTISQESEWPAGLNSDGLPHPDPRLVEKLVEELKSQGKFDQIRNDCFAEVDTQPAYQNLRSRVTETVQRFLGRQRWNPSLNKNQLRNQLKQHIQQTPFMEDGVERIVEQVVNPKIMSVIQPEVENLICSWFDVERPDGTSKTGPGLRGDISPLTPERDIKHKEPYSESVYAQIAPKGHTESMLPAPYDNTQERSTTPQIKVKNETTHEKTEKDNSLKAKDYTVKDFLSGNATSHPTAAKIKKSTEFEDLLKKSEMIKSAKKESEEAIKKKMKEKEISRKNKEKEKEIMRRKKEKDILRRQKEIDTTTKRKECNPKHARDELQKEKSKKYEKEKETSEKIDNKDKHSRTDNIIEKDDEPEVFCLCRKEDDGTFMIGCDECDEWYHPRCINISMERIKELENEEWACLQCENKKGNVSPLTPPPLLVRPASPRTPPLPPNFNKTEELVQAAPASNIPLPPPPGEEELQLQEEIVPMLSSGGHICRNEAEMSPVSDAELSDAKSNKNALHKKSRNSFDSSTPSNLPLSEPPLPPELEARLECTPPPPPPDKSFSKPPSPLTSPIGSSPDDMEEPLRESMTGYSSHSVMASDLRTPRQMQSQYKRAAVSDPAIAYNQGDTQSSVSASDISDTDLPDASGNTISEDNEQEHAHIALKDNDPEDDLESLEKAKAELQAKLAATNIGDELDVPMEDSDGEVHTDDSNDYLKRFREIASGGKLQTKAGDSPTSVVRTAGEINQRADSSMSPISSEGPTPEPTKDKNEEAETIDKDDHAAEKIHYRKKDDPDDDDTKDRSLSCSKASGNSQVSYGKSSATTENQEGTYASETSSSKNKSSKERHHSNSSRRKHRNSSSKEVDKDRRSSHSSSSHHSSTKGDKKSSRHKSSHDRHRHSHHSTSHTQDKAKERRDSSSKTEHNDRDDSCKRPEKHDRKADKETKKEIEKKREQKLKTVEEKVNQTYKLKSDKYESIDMFAPKQTKSPSIVHPKTLNNGCSPIVPVTTGSRIQTTLNAALDNQNTASVSASSSNFIPKDKEGQKRKEQEKTNTTSSFGSNENAINYERKKVDRIKEQLKKEREHNVASSSPKSLTKGDSDTSDKARKIFPELPVSKCDGDKIEQHKDDFVATKRRLEEARARKMADIHRKKEMDKVRRKSHSGSLSNSSSGEKLNITLSPSMKNTKNEPVNLEMEIKLMEESRRKDKKKENKDKRRRDKDKIDRDRNKEHHESDNDSSDACMTPTKQAVKRKFSSRESEDSSSDNEWKKCGLKEWEPATLKREPRKRKPTKKYSSSEYNTDESWEETETYKHNAMQNVVPNSKCFSDSQLEAEVRKSAEMIMATDLDIKPFEGFADVKVDTKTHDIYQMHITTAVKELEPGAGNNQFDISDACLPENFYTHHDYIYLSELNVKTVIPNEWRGAKKVAALLKKNFGGNPTVVRPMPRWLKLKLDRWGLRRHEVNLIFESPKFKNSRIYKEDECDRLYPMNQDEKNRYKRLRIMLNELPEMQMPNTKNIPASSSPANIKRRRDTVEKNLDEMFSSDQEDGLDVNGPKRKKTRIDNDVEAQHNVHVSLSPILEPFYGFQENETSKSQQVNNSNKDQSNVKTVLASISHLKPSIIQVDSNGNTFGMSSVLASPISDFSSDYDDDDVSEQLRRNPECKEEDTRLPMSVGMNYSMVQYLRQALQNEEDTIKELNRILAMPNSNNIGATKEEKLPQVDANTEKLTKSNSFVKRKTRKEKNGIGSFYLYSEDEESSIASSTNVSSIGLHVLPPSPISCSDSLSSHEGVKNVLD